MSLGGGAARLETVRAGEEVVCGLGTFRARHVAAASPDGRGPGYHAWLVQQVPFGLARFEVKQGGEGAGQRVLFRATAARTGTNAGVRK
jgi:hypothetical protein